MVQEYKPWNLMKQNKSDMRIKKLLFFIYESLRIAGILLQPIIPSLSDDLLNRLNVKKEERFYESALIDTKRIENKKLQSNSNILFKRL
jgi:methionyl-tRNA synthetase